MSRRPWYKRYPSDFIAGTLQLSCEEKGAYSVVLDLIYDHGGPIPDDAQWIARVCNLSTRRWNQIRTRLLDLGKVTAGNGVLTNKRALSQLKVEEREHESFSSAGKLGAEKTNERRGQPGENNDLEEKGPLGETRHTRSQKLDTRKKPPAPNGAAPPMNEMPPIPKFLRRTKEPKNASAGTKKRKTRITPDWEPTAEHFKLGSGVGFDEGQVRSQADQYRDHAGMHGRTLVDWDKGFNNWLRKAAEFAGRGRGPAGKRQAGPGGRDDTGVVAALRELQGRR